MGLGRQGICVPSTCSRDEVNVRLHAFANDTPTFDNTTAWVVHALNCHAHTDTPHFSTGDIAML